MKATSDIYMSYIEAWKISQIQTITEMLAITM